LNLPERQDEAGLITVQGFMLADVIMIVDLLEVSKATESASSIFRHYFPTNKKGRNSLLTVLFG
jgi:hypothetical protein